MNKISYKIPISNATEPAQVSLEDIEKIHHLQQLKDFHISFQIIMEDDSARPDQKITSKEMVKRLAKKIPFRVFQYFINGYLEKMVRSQDNNPKFLLLTFIRKVNEKQPLAKGKEGVKINCLLKIIKEHATGLKSYKTWGPIIKELNEKYFEEGVGEEAIDEICKRLKVNIVVYSLTNEVWYERIVGSNVKSFIVLDHDTHYTLYNPNHTLLETKINRIEYVKNDMEEFFLDNTSIVKYPYVNNDRQITAFITPDGTMYRMQNIFYDEKDFNKNKENLKLAKTFTLTSRYTKEKIEQYNIERYWKDERLFDFVKAADFHSKYWCAVQDYEKGFMIDQNRAYMQYKECEYYEKYLFPRQPTHFYTVPASITTDELLEVTGFFKIDNVNISSKYAYLIKTSYLQNGAVYTSPELKYFRDMNISFDIIAVAFSHQKQDIDFKIELTEWQLNCGDVNKKFIENSIMGSLIMESKDYLTAISCKDPLEFKQLQFDLASRIVDVDFEKNIITYTVPGSEALKGAYHVHAYILAYQQIQFLKTVLTIPFDNILKVKVDAIVTQAPFDNFDHRLWHTSDSKKVTTPLISNIDFSRKYPALPQYELPRDILKSQFLEITGDAGVGKTYYATHLNLYDAAIIVPNNNLRLKFKKEHPDVPCSTYHKAFQIQETNNKKINPIPPPKYKNYILDECSMICKGMMNAILNHPHARDGNMILIHDPAQLNPVIPCSKDWSLGSSPYFTNGDEYKKRKWHHVHLEKQQRQTDKELLRRLNLLREMRVSEGTKCKDNTKEKIKLFEDRIITTDKLLELYRYDTEDLLLASTNEVVDKWNEVLMKASRGMLKVKYTRSANNYAKNERVIMQKTLGINQTLAFASTIHLVQGLTFNDRIFLSMSNLGFDPALFYTACSRAKTLDQIFLVD